jgi:hypothetical protein
MIRASGGCRFEREVERGEANKKSGARRFPENLSILRAKERERPQELPRISEQTRLHAQGRSEESSGNPVGIARRKDGRQEEDVERRQEEDVERRQEEDVARRQEEDVARGNLVAWWFTKDRSEGKPFDRRRGQSVTENRERAGLERGNDRGGRECRGD